MKKLTYLILTAAVALSATGCVKELLNGGAVPGTAITFSANTYYDNGPETKTAYSGAFFGTTTRYERIDWVSGDKIRIYSPEATHRNSSTRHWADYDIDASTIQHNNTLQSTARIKNETNGNGLVWGDESAYSFFALYPSPNSSGAYTGLSMNNNVVTAPLPSSQTLTKQSGTRIYKPDMDLAYMHGAVSGAPGGLPVDIPFKPLMTAFEITLGTDDPNGLEVKDIYLNTDASGSYLTGTFTATINANNTVTVGSTFTNPSRILHANLPEFAGGGTLTIQHGSPITFTLFALPITLQHLGLKVVLANNTVRTITFKRNNQWMDFAPFRKYRISNLDVPAGETFDYTLDVYDPVTNVGFDATHPLNSYGHLATTTTTNGLPFAVKSYKTSSATHASTAVTWKMQFLTSSNTWSYNLSDAAYYDKLALSAVTGAGGTAAQNVRADISRNHNQSTEYNHSGSIDEDSATATLRARTPLPTNTTGSSSDGYFDLSRHPVYGTIDGSDQPQETANCYVITAPGKYKFPLVYGNAIRAGATNAVSYSPTIAPGTNDNSHFMRQFLRHDDQPIAGPWITTDNSISVADAVVVWQDGSNSEDMQILFAEDISVSGNYIKFEIKQDKIRPGNIVLAARNASGTIVWSWHLWVTDKDLTPIAVNDAYSQTHQMMKYNLGWTDALGAGRYKWDDWRMKVRVVQIEDGNVVGASREFFINQLGESGEVDPNVGSNTFYQWGRKDPFLPANYGNSNRPYYTDPNLGYQILENGPDGLRVCWRVPPTTSANVTVGHSIQHPNYQYARDITKGGQTRRIYVGAKSSDWGIIGNLWDANLIPYTNTAAGTPDPYNDRLVVKTVYDPCPPGFCVPNGRAYTGLTGGTGWKYASSWLSNTRYIAGQGFEFQTNVAGKIFFPFTGARGGNGVYIYDVASLGYYWTSQPDDFNGSYAVFAKKFFLNDNVVLRADDDQDRAAAYGIRPVLQVNFTN